MRTIEEKFKLTRDVSGISETDITVTTGQGMQDIWKYKVPPGYALVFTQADTFAAYLSTTVPAEAGAGSFIAIEKRDGNQKSAVSILDTVRYSQIKDFTDTDKLVRLDIDPGKEVVVGEDEYLIIQGNINGNLDASLCYFELTCKRVRRTML